MASPYHTVAYIPFMSSNENCVCRVYENYLTLKNTGQASKKMQN